MIVGIEIVEGAIDTVKDFKAALAARKLSFAKGGVLRIEGIRYKILARPKIFVKKGADPAIRMLVRRSRCRLKDANQRLAIAIRTKNGTTVGCRYLTGEVGEYHDVYYSFGPARKPIKDVLRPKNKDGTWTDRDAMGRIIVHDNQECERLVAEAKIRQAEEQVAAEKANALRIRFIEAERAGNFKDFTFEEKRNYLEQELRKWAFPALEVFLQDCVGGAPSAVRKT